MKLDHFYHLDYSDYCLRLYCYIHTSVNVSFGLLWVFVAQLMSLHGTSNQNPLFNPQG